jgi:hypothetical protein
MNLFQSETEIKIISIILGFGFASLFRTVCTSEKCMIIKGPNIKNIQNNTYKIHDKCYTYKPISTHCVNPSSVSK